MASDLGREAKDALLKAIKDKTDEINSDQSRQSIHTHAGALKALAEAYALLERPIQGTGR